MIVLDIESKKVLGLPTTRCSCRSMEHWFVLYSFPTSAGRMRVFGCSRCDEEIELPVRYHSGPLFEHPPQPVHWTEEMKLHLMDTPRPVDWGDTEPPSGAFDADN